MKRNYIIRLIVIIIVWIISSSYYSQKNSEPLYYLFYTDDNVTIYHSRSIHYNRNNIVNFNDSIITLKYDSLEIEEINRCAAILAYEEWEDSLKHIKAKQNEVKRNFNK